MTLEPYTLAMLPMSHLTNRVDPFDRYCRGTCALEASYREVVNIGVHAYQLHTYLGLVQKYFDPNMRRTVHELQIKTLDGIGGTGQAIDNALTLFMTALETRAVSISSTQGDVDVPLEMNVALLLLLDTPQSPDFAANPAQRSEHAGRIGKDVDWCFAECLGRGRTAIVDAFTPIFSIYVRRVLPRKLPARWSG